MSCARDLCVLYLVALGLLCLISAGEADMYDCCYTYTKKQLPLKVIKDFTTQNSFEVCDIDAVIFITRKFRVCANPKEQWVINATKAISKRRKKTSKTD
ncbi:C-C motif chemokine 20 [Xenopus laevis]|uniref:C-C motif chemokine n=2 Tax=Xenopus laevis TaxID=8355 RepID=A0A1L8GBB5_XENLA|nr:C-C motif chemokine 20 [Xenopus laevis]OCT81170.1 hypothetical protein XELAEV_18027983mg [Xenopus laevis]